MESIKAIIRCLFVVFFMLRCKNTKKQERVNSTGIKSHVKVDNIPNANLTFQDSLKSELPIGSPLFLSNELYNDFKEQKKLEYLFHYYDTINGIPSPYFKVKKADKYSAFYKPTKADTINAKDKFALQSKTDYSYFNLVKILPNINSNQLLIFEGKSINHDYDGNILITNRKDLVIVDSSMNIIDELNIYYDYSDGINARTKLFYIDKNYKILIRYYYENEEGVTKFTPIKNYIVKANGTIISN